MVNCRMFIDTCHIPQHLKVRVYRQPHSHPQCDRFLLRVCCSVFECCQEVALLVGDVHPPARREVEALPAVCVCALAQRGGEGDGTHRHVPHVRNKHLHQIADGTARRAPAVALGLCAHADGDEKAVLRRKHTKIRVDE